VPQIRSHYYSNEVVLDRRDNSLRDFVSLRRTVVCSVNLTLRLTELTRD